MVNERPKFSMVVHFYLGLFIVAICLSPIIAAVAADKRHALHAYAWAAAYGGSISAVGLLWYASIRCSSERLTYREGLLFVTSYMMTGWSYFSLVFVFPALLATAFASIAFSVLGEFRGGPSLAAHQFHRLVAAFYRYRMHQ